MKKLSVLIALMLCITIGGVYATWTYSLTDDIADAFAESKVTIADAEFVGSNGVYKITSNLVLTVDQANDDHETELVFSSNDANAIHLTVTFTPAANAPKAVKDNAVLSELYFDTTTPMTYNIDNEGNYKVDGTPTPIIKLTNAKNDRFEENITWTKQNDGTFTYSLNEDQLKDQIQLSQTFVLDIKAEHDAFRAALNGNIVARVTDGIVS
jgi:hypothetical protein